MGIQISGTGGTVVWGYHLAAEVGAWSLNGGWLHAQLRTANPFQLTQRPLVFTIDNSAAGRPNVERHLLDVTIEGNVLTARLGPKKG